MPENLDLGFALGLEPEQAVSYFKSKGWDFSFDWYDIWQEAHTKSFTVAKAMQVEVLDDIREWVDKAIKDGVTLQEFTKELAPRLQKRGWWGRDVVQSPKTGALTVVELGSPTRLETIYRTNTQVAYNVGRYRDQVLNAADRPYWQYVAVMDTLTRPTHAALNGKVFKATDPFWHSHYPPNGFNCRCRVRALTKEQVDARGLEVLEGEGKLSESTMEVARGVEVPVTVFKGYGINMHPDPGWSYNPGEQDWEPKLPPHVPQVVKEYKSAVDGYGLAKEIPAGHAEGLTELLRALYNETPDLFHRGYVGVKVVKPADFPDNKDNPFFMATNSRGVIYLMDHTFKHLDNLNPAKDLFAAMDKIRRGKKLDFNQEYSVESLWHEILHNRARGKVELPEHDFDRTVMEAVNQYVARHTYPDFLLRLGGFENYGPRVLKDGYGYSYMVRNLQTIIKASGLDENKAVEALQQVNVYKSWRGHKYAVADALAQVFGKESWSRQFLQTLFLLEEDDPNLLAQRVREIILEN